GAGGGSAGGAGGAGGATGDNPTVCVSIADTGTGIAPDLLPKVFERGVSGRDGGSGLGLAVSRDLISAHGGTTSIQSQLGKGTTVSFSVPEYREPQDE
ncbi:MAG: ATP-binding protein, partial [Coriobacteriales bacterium]|nr:ATP-binding protein [Coriobacteriales bacterium]